MRLLTVRAGLVVAVLLAACTPKLDVPDTARISCTDDSPCPAGWQCNKAGFCAKNGQLDTTPPALVGAATLDGRPVKRGGVVTLRFTVSEPLRQRPVVKLHLEETLAADLAMDEQASQGLDYVFTGAAAAGSEPQDRACPLTIELEDVAGNVSGTLQGGAVRFDFLAPEVVASKVSLRHVPAHAGTQVQVLFTVTEALAADPQVTLARGGSLHKDAASSGLDYVYDYDATATDADGETGVLVAMADLAGNVPDPSPVPLEPRVVFDSAAPTLTLAVNPADRPARAWELVTVTATASEALDARGVALDAGVLPLGLPTVSGLVTTWTYQVQPGALAAFGLEASASDLAGNAAAPVQAGVQVDGVAPVVAHVVVKTPLCSAAAGRDEVRVELDLSEPVGAGLVVKAGGVVMTCSAWRAASPSHRCTRPVTATDVDGAQGISVVATDAAGNVGYGAGTVEFDLAAPRALTSGPNLRVYKGGTTIQYRVDVNEPLAVAPALHVSLGGVEQATFFGDPVSQTSTGFAWTRSVAGLVDGDYVVTLDLVDAAGNRRDGAAGGTFTVDATPPVVTLLSPDAGRAYSRMANFNALTITLDTENLDAVDGGLQVSAAGRALACGGFNDAGSPRYTCTRTVGLGDPMPDGGFGPDTDGAFEGPTSAVVQVVDSAGNQAAASVGLVFDFTPPKISSPALSIIPCPTCRLAQVPEPVTATTVGSKIHVTFAVNEPLGLSFNRYAWFSLQGDWTATRNDQASSTLYAEYDLLMNGLSYFQARKGTNVIYVGMIDLVGNLSSYQLLGSVAWDVDPPEFLTPQQDDKILYRRAPWGTTAAGNGGAGTFTVETLAGTTGAVEPNASITFWDGIDMYAPVKPQIIGQTKADATGSFPAVALTGGDHPRVYLTQTDAAGNIDLPDYTFPISNVEWTATLGRKLATSTFENPHLLTATPVLSSALMQDPTIALEPSAANLDRAREQDGQAMLQAAQASWTDLTPNGLAPQARYDTAMVYDSARHKVVLFGGQFANGGGQDTWEWDGATGRWTNRTVAGARPSRRQLHVMTYDARRGKVVLFGGQVPIVAGGGDLGDTWEWDPATGAWSDRTPTSAAASPPARSGAAMVFDAARGRPFLFGGAAANYPKDDCWEWDGAAGVWTNRTPPGLRPAARQKHAMAADSDRKRVVLFGSVGPADTWEWDGQAGTWANRTPTGAMPSARYNPAMTYDSARRKVVLVGGNSSPLYADLWEWDGAAGAWTQPSPTGFVPAALSHLALAFDVVRARVVAFGGYIPSRPPITYQPDLSYETLEYDGVTSTWADRTHRAQNLVPTPQYRVRGLLDGNRGKVLLFREEYSSPWSDPTWEWDLAAKSWTRGFYAGGSIAMPRTGYGLAWDPIHRTALVFGGQGSTGTVLRDLWAWNPVAGTWTSFPISGDWPAPMAYAAAVYDPTVQQMLLFGSDGVTWAWDVNASVWLNRTPPGASPPSRNGHAMAFDPSRGKVLLLGPSAGFGSDELWEWDGTAGTWKAYGPTGLGYRAGHAMAWDEGRQRLVVQGGENAYFALTDLWEWDPATDAWAQRTPSGAKPLGATVASMVSDPATHRLVLVTASDDDLRVLHTWELNDGADTRPAELFQFAFANAQAEAGSIIKSVTATFFAGGVGYASGAPVNGAELVAWDGTDWRVRAANACPATSTTYDLLEWKGTGAVDWAAMMFGPQQLMSFAARPVQSSGSGTAQVAVDSAQVSVRYFLPYLF